MIVDELGQIYVADYNNHRVICWREGRIIIGEKGYGNRSDQLSSPVGLSIDVEGNFYVADQGNHRILKFEIDTN